MIAYLIGMMIGLIYACLVAFFRSVADIISKYNLEKDGDEEVDSEIVSLFYRLTGVPVLLFILFILGVPDIETILIEVAGYKLNTSAFSIIFVTSLISVLATVLYVKALDISDISLVSPIKALSPLVVIFTGLILLGEVPGFIGIIGIILITIGSYTLEIEEGMESSIKPFKKIVSDRGVQYTVIIVLIYGISAPLDKFAVEATSPIFYSFSLYTGSSIGLFLYIILFKDIEKLKNAPVKRLAPIGFSNGFSSFFQMTAISLTLVVYVIAIKRLSLLLNTLYGVFFLEEGTSIYRIIGSSIIVIGSVIVSISVIN